MARACMFCGGRPTTREHVYPRWIRDALPIASARYRTSDAEGNPLWEQRTFDIEAKVVCADCNTGWMSDLEAETKPLLANPMMYGSDLAMSATQQRTIALWAMKTAFVLEAYRKSGVFDHLPEWQARWMPRTRTRGESADPPPGISVVMFGRQLVLTSEDGIEHFAVSRSVGIALREPPHDSKGYVSTFVVGHVGFQIFGVDLQVGGTPNVQYAPWVLERTTPLWPPSGRPTMWPPSLVMSTEEAIRFGEWWAFPQGRGTKRPST
jgi:hypothetical protein